MKSGVEYIEGPVADVRLKAGMKLILSVPKELIKQREAEYKKRAALLPKRGPKPKPSINPLAPSRAAGA